MTLEALIGLIRQGWLVVAVVLFMLIVWRTWRPSARAAMDRHAQIPFKIKDDRHGDA